MTTLKLEVSKSYRTRDGRKVTITGKYTYDGYFIGKFLNDLQLIYDSDGFCYGANDSSIISEWQDEPESVAGMDLSKITVRDYFAGCALQGVLAGDTEGGLDTEQAARIAISMADALMKARGE